MGLAPARFDPGSRNIRCRETAPFPRPLGSLLEALITWAVQDTGPPGLGDLALEDTHSSLGVLQLICIT